MDRIRLAYLVSQYPTVTHTFILREIRGLRECGFDIDVISVRSPDRPLHALTEIEQAEARGTFYVLASGIGAFAAAHAATLIARPISYFAGLFFALRLARTDLYKALRHLAYFAEAVVAGRQIRRRGIGHVHTHFSSTVLLILARVFAITWSATIHGSGEFVDPAGFFLREKVASARFVCAISNYGASQLMAASAPQHWHKIEVNRLGVDTALFTPQPRLERGDRIELLSVGSLVPPKGYPILLAALARLVHEERQPLHLRIVGGGSSRQDLERTIAALNLDGHVTLEGPCDQERLRVFYAQADLFVLASFAEGIPVVLMEAMSMEIPCIATWITGIPELIQHTSDGWLVPPGNERQLAQAIANLSGNAALRQELGKAARARVQRQYELKTNIGALAELYRRRLGHTAP